MLTHRAPIARWRIPAIPLRQSWLSKFLRAKQQKCLASGDCLSIAPGVTEEPLQQLTMLVTAEGRWVLPDSEEFLAAVDDPDPDYDAVGFAVRNVGFVRFQILDRVVTEIELHPRNVDLRALLAVEKLLGEVGTNLFRIKYLDDEWRSEISSSAEHTMSRLRELCAPAFEPPKTNRFQVEQQDPAVLFDTPAGRAKSLGRMAMKWRVAFGNFDSSVMGVAARNELLSKLAVVGIQTHDPRPILRFFGDSHRWAGDTYRYNGIGQPVDAMPDREYGAWLARFYEAVASSGQPRYDIITADMQYHNEAGQPHRTTRYERLLLPWRASGETLVTSCIRLASSDAAPLRDPEGGSSSARKAPKSS
jgi:hypothetical protein